MRRLVILVIAIVVLGLPAAADAASVELQSRGTTGGGRDGSPFYNSYELIYHAAPGETNHLTVSPTSNGVHLVDTGAAIAPGSACRADDGGVTCTGTAPASIYASYDLGDGDDSATGLRDAIVAGGPGNDAITGGQITVDGGPGADTISCDSQPGDIIATYGGRTNAVDVSLDGVANDGEAGEGDNVGACVDDIQGGSGDDHLTAGEGKVFLSGGPGNDHLKGGPLYDGLNGQEGDDVLDGGGGADFLDGADGNDTLDGRNGSDSMDGGAGDDHLIGGDGGAALTGGAGNDVVEAGAGADRIVDGPGDDTVHAGAGDDFVEAWAGRDLIDGGPGIDTVDYSQHGGTVSISLDNQANDGSPGEGDNLIGFENATGTGRGTIVGDDGPNALGAASVIDGRGGNDVIVGGGPVTAGARLIGGPGADVFANIGAHDTVDARDGERDELHCYAYMATLDIDPIDAADDCNPITQLSLTGVNRKLRSDHRGAVHIVAKCAADSPTPCAGGLRLVYRSRTVASAKIRLAPGQRTVLRLKLRRADARRLKRVQSWPIDGVVTMTGKSALTRAWLVLPPRE